MRISQADLKGHKATLRKAAEDNLIGGKTGFNLAVEQLKKQLSAALDAWFHVSDEVIPGIASVILVRSIDQQIIQPRQIQRRRKPTIAGNAVAKAVQHDQQAARLKLSSLDQLAIEHNVTVRLLLLFRNLLAANPQ